MPNGHFEKPPAPPVEKKSEEREGFESVTPEEMRKWRELKLAESRAIVKRKLTPLSENERGELEEIETKREAEKERLTGPVFGRMELLADPEKQKQFIKFIEEWDKLSEDDRLDRLDRVWNELRDMRPSEVAEQIALFGMVKRQEINAQNYFQAVEKAKPLTKKEDGEWEKLENKRAQKGLDALGGRGRRRLTELEQKGRMEREKLLGKDPSHFYLETTLMPSLAREKHLAFLEEWNGLDSAERDQRLKRVGIIQRRLETDPMQSHIEHMRVQAEQQELERERREAIRRVKEEGPEKYLPS